MAESFLRKASFNFQMIIKSKSKIQSIYSGRAKFWKGQGANYQCEGTVRAKLC